MFSGDVFNVFQALDVLIQQLSASLDEDLLDVDEYERGITDPYFDLWSPYNKVT